MGIAEPTGQFSAAQGQPGLSRHCLGRYSVTTETLHMKLLEQAGCTELHPGMLFIDYFRPFNCEPHLPGWSFNHSSAEPLSELVDFAQGRLISADALAKAGSEEPLTFARAASLLAAENRSCYSVRTALELLTESGGKTLRWITSTRLWQEDLSKDTSLVTKLIFPGNSLYSGGVGHGLLLVRGGEDRWVPIPVSAESSVGKDGYILAGPLFSR